MKTGAVLVYQKSESSNFWYLYPYTLTYDYSNGYSYTFFYTYDLNRVSVLVEDSNSNTKGLPMGAIGNFKVIAVAGNIGLLNYIDKSDYGAVKTALNLMD